MLQSSPKRSKVHKRAHKSSGCGLFLSNWWQVLSCVFRSNRLKCRQFVFHKYSLSAAPENHCTLYPSRSQMDTFVVCLQGIYSLCFHVINVCRKIEFRRCMCYEKWIHITNFSLTWYDILNCQYIGKGVVVRATWTSPIQGGGQVGDTMPNKPMNGRRGKWRQAWMKGNKERRARKYLVGKAHFKSSAKNFCIYNIMRTFQKRQTKTTNIKRNEISV